MLEISNIKLRVSSLHGNTKAEASAGRTALYQTLHLKPEDISSMELHRRSIDARKRNNIILVLTYRLTLRGGFAAEKNLLHKLSRKPIAKHIKRIEPEEFALPTMLPQPPRQRPVVVGAGCAGLFCALVLARAGLAPLLIERGDDAQRRTEAVTHFNQTGELDLESNIQFGLGGAGTFSDGKLNTGTKSPSHRFILEAFVEAGASRSILWDAKPHVGSDVLPTVVTNLVRMIKAAGGDVAFRTRLVDLTLKDQQIQSVTVEHTEAHGDIKTEIIPATQVILATGHSARDVFELLNHHGVRMERKTFAMGVRIEHLQADINRTLYGSEAGNPVLGAAAYKLSVHLPSGRSAFSFCMCPGGSVVAASSEKNGVVTNGMSLSKRNGTNANSGLLANVFPDDLLGDNVLEGIALQRTCERAAFEAGGGAYVAPAQLVGDFVRSQKSSGMAKVQPTYPRGVSWGSIEGCLPDYITNTLREALPRFDHKLHGFAADDAVLTGVETRSSSPVRITRNDSGQSINVKGLWPAGEGAGYAGGIMSAAADGIRIAELVAQSYERMATVSL